jgi:hypothetical protein
VEPGQAAGQQAGQPAAQPPREGAIFEPPPPGPIYEPPPPPEPKHVAPRTALYVGARVGWFLPFGNVYAKARPGGQTYVLDRVPWSDYASSGVMVEGDIGARLGRHYAVFAFWERAELGSGDAEADLYGGQDGASTDFWGLGLRASSNANSLGLLTEVAIGYRQAKTQWKNGTELRFTDGVLEGRIGFGADIRLDPMFSISPMLNVGVGAFGEIRRVLPDGSGFSETGVRDEADSHAWLTLGIGGHADFFGAK